MRIPALIALLSANPAFADITVTFAEGAPTDRFTIAANDSCVTGPVQMTIDLSGSDAGLVFDVTAAGAGVEVFQPFVLVSGAQNVTGYSELTDGDTMLRLDIATLTTPIAFTTDLDDTIGQREITISNAEIAGATVTLSTADETITAPFGDNAVARLTPNGCAG